MSSAECLELFHEEAIDFPSHHWGERPEIGSLDITGVRRAQLQELSLTEEV
jgi:hypothetical protein